MDQIGQQQTGSADPFGQCLAGPVVADRDVGRLHATRGQVIEEGACAPDGNTHDVGTGGLLIVQESEHLMGAAQPNEFEHAAAVPAGSHDDQRCWLAHSIMSPREFC